MKLSNFFSLLLLLVGLSLSEPPAQGAEGVADKARAPVGYCHLKFPTIREDTLYTDRPVLKDPRDGDFVDFYGPCDYDPLGKDAVLRQRTELVRERNRLEDGR
jgi:hypothetical protein